MSADIFFSFEYRLSALCTQREFAFAKVSLVSRILPQGGIKMTEKNQNQEGLRKRSNSFENVIHSLLQEAGGVLTSKTVVGDPIEVGDTLLIPLSDVTVGAAAGSNNGSDKNAGMGGFTAKMSPSAVLIIKNGNTKVVNIKDQNSLSRLVDMVPEVVDKFVDAKNAKTMMSDEEASSRAFPEKDNKTEE